MGKRRRRKKVELERAQDWLERSESGESPKKIGGKDGYDVRTVRKYIELASEEREGKEARAAVVRGAYEKHYKDMVNFANSLDNEIDAEIPVSQTLRENRMWEALKEHQPKASLFRGISKASIIFPCLSVATAVIAFIPRCNPRYLLIFQ